MRALVTGQIGLDKKQFLDQVQKIAKMNGEDLQVYHIGDMMYREAPDVRPGRILDLPLARLNSLRRAVFPLVSVSPSSAVRPRRGDGSMRHSAGHP